MKTRQGTVEGVVSNGSLPLPIDQFLQDVRANLEGKYQGGKTNVIQTFSQPADQWLKNGWRMAWADGWFLLAVSLHHWSLMDIDGKRMEKVEKRGWPHHLKCSENTPGPGKSLRDFLEVEDGNGTVAICLRSLEIHKRSVSICQCARECEAGK